MSLNDQFEHGRIPIIPLSHTNKDLAQRNEFIIDYGEDGTYHMYIAHHNDPNILIDLTACIIKEFLPNAAINANNFQITLEGIKEPTSLQGILNYIYKNFTLPDNINGFLYSRDISKVLDNTTKSVLLKNTDGTCLLPITTADNVYDASGMSLQDRLNNITRLGFSIDYVWATEENQTEFEIVYPFANYSDLMEVRIGTVYVDKTRYCVVPDIDSEGNYTTAKLVFINGEESESIEKGRRIDLIFIYNSTVRSEGQYEHMSGSALANSSVSAIKLEKTSDSYTLNDSSSIATSAAVFNLFSDLSDFVSNITDNAYWGIDLSNSADTIMIPSISDECKIINVATSCTKKSTVSLVVGDNGKTYNIIYPDGSSLTRGISANRLLKLLVVNNTAYLLSGHIGELKTARYIHTCVDQETSFSYAGLDYNDGDIINVYRNGVRLFEDLDYSIDKSTQQITVFVRTEEGERIVFEALSN